MILKSQEASILEYLQKGYSLTPLEALQKFHTLRLSAHIFTLKRKGYYIKTSFVKNPTNGKSFASYTLIPNLKTEEEHTGQKRFA